MLGGQVRRIAVLDFGGQYAHLIARRVRQLGFYSELFEPEAFVPAEHPGVAGVILSGGPRSVTELSGRPKLVEGALRFDLRTVGVPVLGICYGHQLIAALLGGEVVSGQTPEYGMTTVRCETGAELFEGLDADQRVWMSHGDHVEKVPCGFCVTASSDRVPVAAYESMDRPIFGVQFHPEVTHTEHGLAMLERFLSRCAPERSWRRQAMAEALVEQTRAQAEGKRLFLLLSGGVDSLVALAVCVRAVGPERVFSLHVDTGLMRQGESEDVMVAMRALGFRNLEVARAEALFLERLKGIADPEEKRRRIGALFVEVLRAHMARHPLGNDWMLVQGTIYPDRIESGGTRQAAKIKTHHNRVPEIERLLEQGRVIEPLADLYKDEVRALGLELGLPEASVNRHPFPGPGLGIRVLASDGQVPAGFDAESERVEQLAAAAGLRASVLPVQSVGVQGDGRTYRHPAAVWAEHGWPGWRALKSVAAEVVNRVASVNRVVFCEEPLPAGSLSLRPCEVDKATLDRLRRVDALMRERTEAMREIWQMPVVALPLFEASGRQAFVVRPVWSEDAMTAEVFEMERSAWVALSSEARTIAGVGPLLYDLTTKPPGTIEWE